MTSQEPYDEGKFQAAVSNGGRYACGGNLAWVNPFRSPTPGVPISATAVRDLMQHYFAQPTPHYPQSLRVAVNVRAGHSPAGHARGWMVSISPEEMLHALWLSMAKSLDDEEAMRVWKACVLSAPMELVHIDDFQTELFMAAVAMRERLGADYHAMFRTGPQRAFEVVSFRNKHKSMTGALLGAQALFEAYNKGVQWSKGSEFSATFVDTALTCYDRILVHDGCRQLVLEAEEEFGQQSPFNSLYRLEAFTKKAGRHDMAMLMWLLQATNDLTRNDHVSPSELSLSALTGRARGNGGKGFLDLLIYRRHVRDVVLGRMLDDVLSDSAAKLAIRKALADHASYRMHFGGKVAGGVTYPKDLSWLGVFRSSAHMFARLAEDLVYLGVYDHILKTSMRVNKGVAETMEHETLTEQFDDIRATMGTEGGVPMGVPMPAASAADIVSEMAVDFKVACGVKSNMSKVDESKQQLVAKLNPEDKGKLRAFEEEAEKLVSTYVKLITMPKTDAELTQLLKEAPACQITGDATSYCLFLYDPKLAGEAASCPKYRVCSIRAQHLRSVVKCAMEARGNGDAIRDGDAYLYFDAGRHGNEGVLLGSLVNSAGKRVEKTHNTIYLTYSEDALDDARITRGFMSLRQLEQLHVCTSGAPLIRKKRNRVYPGTTVGDIIGPVRAGDAENVLHVTFKHKKEVYAKEARVAPSGASGLAADDPENNVRRGENDTEPLSYHSRVPELYSEIMHRFEAKAVWDLTCLDGVLAMTCIMESRPYVGIAQTEAHKNLLLPYLARAVFHEYQKEGSPLYRPDVAGLMAGGDGQPAKAVPGGAKPKPPGKGPAGGAKPKAAKAKAKSKNKKHINAALDDDDEGGDDEEGLDEEAEEEEDSDLAE